MSDPWPVSLCARCEHVRKIATPRGSVFYLCELSASDHRFDKYPRQPIVACSGFVNEIPPTSEIRSGIVGD
jgi:hypothetical protein